jgi:hypothetical protein
MASDRDCGESFTGSLTSINLESSSSKTSHTDSNDGSPACAAISAPLATFRLPSRFVPGISGHRTPALEPSSLPTPTAQRYGTSNNGDPHDTRAEYATRGKASLWTLAKTGRLPYHPPGPLHPGWIEWAMGFPPGWTKID